MPALYSQTFSPSLGLILQKPQVKSAETAGRVGMGRNAECCLRAVGGADVACPPGQPAWWSPPIAFVCLEKFAVVISSRPWPAFHSAGHLQGRSAPLFSFHRLEELHLFSVSSRARPSEKKKKKKKHNEDEDRFFQLGGSR